MLAEPVWVHRDGWAGRRRIPGVLVKRNAKRSRVLYEGRERLVPNYAITPRTELAVMTADRETAP